MNAIKFVSVFFLMLAIGLIPVPITANNKKNPKVSEQFEKDARRAIRKAFRNEGIKKFVDEDLKSTVFVTFRVDKNSQLHVVKIESAGEKLNNLIKNVVKKDKITLDECFKYRYFRIPLTFIYKE